MLNGLRTVRSFTRQNEVLTRSLRHVQTLYNEEVVQPLNFASCLSIKPRKFASKSFQDLGINESLCNGLKEMNITKPTHIQQRSIEAILAKKDVLCSAQTGTGKTLAYLLPIVEQLIREEKSFNFNDNRKLLVSRPRALIIVPSRELALQVNEVAKKLAHHAKFSTSVVVSGERKSVQRKNLSRRLDIVVGTPGRIVKCIKEQDFFISSVTKLVVDEADTLFDAKMGFRSELDAIILPLKASAEKRNVQLQFVLVAATIKSPLDQILRKKIGGLEFLCDENIHKIPSTITEEFIRVPVKSKHPALREALLTLGKDSKSIVFCRNTASCQSTEHMLREYEFNSVLLHGSMHQSSRKHSIEEFVSGKADILVCTDLAARGLHFEGVEHVVMFDFPATAVDYVHRAGRTGRAGQKGKVISFVTKYDVELARIIEEAKRRREAIKGFIPTAQDLSETTTLITKTVKERLHLRKGTKKLKKHKLR